MKIVEKKKTKEELEDMTSEELDALLDESEEEDEEYLEMIKKAKEACKSKKKESNVIHIEKDIRVGNIILEKGDKIEVLQPVKESLIPREWDEFYDERIEIEEAFSDFGIPTNFDGQNLIIKTKFGRILALVPYLVR